MSKNKGFRSFHTYISIYNKNEIITDDVIPVPLSPSLDTVPVDDTYCSDEALSESPVDHLIFVIHASKNPDFFISISFSRYPHIYKAA